MSLALSKKLSSHVTRDRENSFWVVQGVNFQTDCRYRNLHISSDLCCALQLFNNEENWFCVILVLCEIGFVLKLEEWTKDIKIILKRKVYDLPQAISEKFSCLVTHYGEYWL